MRTRQHISQACRSRRNALIGVAIGLSILTLQPPRAGAQEIVPKFKVPVLFSVGNFPFGLAVADVTGGPGGAPDGYPDLAVANEGAGTVTFYVNTRDWKPVSDGFGAPTTLSVGAAPAEVAFAKINSDIYLDIVVSAPFDNALYVFLNDAANPGQFLPPTKYSLNVGFFVGPRGLAIADFDNDGHNDAAVASDFESTDAVVVVFNDGLGGLGGQQVPIALNLQGGRPVDIVVGDFERSEDGPPFLDLATANIGHDSISVLRNNGNRDFTPLRRDRPPGCTTLWWGFEGIAVGRFDLGTLDDVACSAEDDDFANVFLGDGQSDFDHDCVGTQDRYQLHPLFDQAFCWGIDAGHLNGGTRQDLAVALQATNEVSVLLGKGDGTFQRPATNSGYCSAWIRPSASPTIRSRSRSWT